MCGRSDHENIGFCNIKFIRNYFIERTVYRSLRKHCESKNGEVVLCIYSASAEFLSAAEKLKKKYPNVMVCDIIADLPGMTNLSRKKSALLQWFIDYKAKKSLKRLEAVDCFVLLTKQMADYLHISKPYCVVEGIASKSQQIERKGNSKKTILYTGTLHQKFGVMNLVNAFSQIESPDYRLMICGIGDSEKAIRRPQKKILAFPSWGSSQEVKFWSGRNKRLFWLIQGRTMRNLPNTVFHQRQWNISRLESL